MKNKTQIQLALLFVSGSILAQDVVFENSNMSLLNLNPSYAGSNNGQRLQTTIRSQWPELSNSFVTYNMAYDAKIKALNGGVGLSLFQDNFAKGLFVDNRVSLSYAQHFNLKNKDLKIIPSFELTYIKRNIDYTRLTFGDIMDGRYGNSLPASGSFPPSSKQNLSFSSGLLFSYKSMYAGMSLKNFNQPDIGLLGVVRMPALFNAHFSYTKKIDSKNSLQFFTSHSQQGSYSINQLRVNALLFKYLELGASIYSGQQANFTMGFRNSFVAANFGYAYCYSKLAGRTDGIYTLGLAFSHKSKSADKSFSSFENW